MSCNKIDKHFLTMKKNILGNWVVVNVEIRDIKKIYIFIIDKKY